MYRSCPLIVATPDGEQITSLFLEEAKADSLEEMHDAMASLELEMKKTSDLDSALDAQRVATLKQQDDDLDKLLMELGHVKEIFHDIGSLVEVPPAFRPKHTRDS